MFVRLFVDENLDRMVPISKQPKEKIQAIIDSCTRQFPEFAERARKRIRTYLKSCRRNKRGREGAPWDAVSLHFFILSFLQFLFIFSSFFFLQLSPILKFDFLRSRKEGRVTCTFSFQARPTPAHLTSVQAEQILATACENESDNAKRMRVGLEPVSQPMPTLPAATVS